MAEFSREFFKVKGVDCKGDFSILSEFGKLKEGHYIPEICEGFGSIGIARIEGKCQLMFPGENDDCELVDFKDFQKGLKE